MSWDGPATWQSTVDLIFDDNEFQTTVTWAQNENPQMRIFEAGFLHSKYTSYHRNLTTSKHWMGTKLVKYFRMPMQYIIYPLSIQPQNGIRLPCWLWKGFQTCVVLPAEFQSHASEEAVASRTPGSCPCSAPTCCAVILHRHANITHFSFFHSSLVNLSVKTMKMVYIFQSYCKIKATYLFLRRSVQNCTFGLLQVYSSSV